MFNCWPLSTGFSNYERYWPHVTFDLLSTWQRSLSHGVSPMTGAEIPATFSCWETFFVSKFTLWWRLIYFERIETIYSRWTTYILLSTFTQLSLTEIYVCKFLKVWPQLISCDLPKSWQRSKCNERLKFELSATFSRWNILCHRFQTFHFRQIKWYLPYL